MGCFELEVACPVDRAFGDGVFEFAAQRCVFGLAVEVEDRCAGAADEHPYTVLAAPVPECVPAEPVSEVSESVLWLQLYDDQATVIEGGGRSALVNVGPPAKNLVLRREATSSKEALMQYVGIDWAPRRAAWCAFDEHGEMLEGMVSAGQDGLAHLVHTVGPDAYGCVDMMSGAVWVREQLEACG